MRRRESCRWTTRPSTPGGRCTSARFGPMASSTWSGARKSRCGRFPILPRDRMRSGMRFWTVCTGPGVAGQTPVHAEPRVRWEIRLAQTSSLKTDKFLSPLAGSLAQAARSNCDAISFRFRSGATSHDLAIGFVCTIQDQHHHPVGDLVSVSLADSLRCADGLSSLTYPTNP